MFLLGESRSGPAPTVRGDVTFGLQFTAQGKHLDLFEAGRSVHSWSAEISTSSAQQSSRLSSSHRNVELEKDGTRTEFTIGTPFYSRHSRDVAVEGGSLPNCSDSYLALGFSDDASGVEQTSVFIMQAEVLTLSRRCKHSANLESERGMHLQYRPLALLAGYRQGDSSLGTVMAISPDGRRIAAAVWSRVYLWSLDPKLFTQGGLDLYFPSRDYNMRKGIGRLRPIALPAPGAVIHSMIWTSEEQLYAVTDRGLISWNIGCMCTGVKEELEPQ